MVDKIKQKMQNGIFFIEDVAGGKPPNPVTDENIHYTSSCISVVCLHEIDGEAEIILGEADQVMPSYPLEFDGILETPSRQLVITDVLYEVLIRAAVPDVRTRIRVWRNHPRWPDQVTVGWG